MYQHPHLLRQHPHPWYKLPLSLLLHLWLHPSCLPLLLLHPLRWLQR